MVPAGLAKPIIKQSSSGTLISETCTRASVAMVGRVNVYNYYCIVPPTYNDTVLEGKKQERERLSTGPNNSDLSVSRFNSQSI